MCLCYNTQEFVHVTGFGKTVLFGTTTENQFLPSCVSYTHAPSRNIWL